MKFLLAVIFLVSVHGEQFEYDQSVEFKTPMQCVFPYLGCMRRAQSDKEKKDCKQAFSACVKHDCDTKKCDDEGQICLGKAKTQTQIAVCQMKWFACAQIVCSKTEYDQSVEFKTPMQCVFPYLGCMRRAQSDKEKEDCKQGFSDCVKHDCDTAKCDAEGKICLEKATGPIGKSACQMKWFMCAQQVCRKKNE